MTALAVARGGLIVEQSGRWLVVRFSCEHDVLSWAVVGGGRRRARAVALTEEAQLEAASVAVEARTAAILEAGITSTPTHRAATGTGTDCLVIASPFASGPSAKYAGKHTDIGHVVGACVRDAVAMGASNWMEEKRLERAQPWKPL